MRVNDSATTRKRLLIVSAMAVAIVFAAAWLALRPRYAEYVVRARVSEVFSALGQCEPYMAEQLASQRQLFPDNVKPSVCGLPDTAAYVTAFRVRGGRVEAQVRGIHPDLDDRVLFIEAIPDPSTNTIRSWRCGTDARSVALKYLPRACVGNG